MAPLLSTLFEFDGVVFHNDESDLAIASASEAEHVFATLMRPGQGVRFSTSQVPRTEGGWLYKIEDDRAVAGISGDVHGPDSYFQSALHALVPGGLICTWGDLPPPMSASEFASSHARC